MKIARVETTAHWVDWCNWLFVKITTDDGLVGWGEASLHGALRSVVAAVEELGEHLIGPGPRRSRAALEPPVQRLALARRGGVLHRDERAGSGAVGYRGQAVMSLGVAAMIGEYRVQWNELMAAALIATLPVVGLYAFLDRHLVSGLTAGAVKG